MRWHVFKTSGRVVRLRRRLVCELGHPIKCSSKLLDAITAVAYIHINAELPTTVVIVCGRSPPLTFRRTVCRCNNRRTL